MRKVHKTISKLKKEAWTEFSIWIRQRFADKRGLVKCVTCGVKRKWNNGIHAGHFVAGRRNNILFDNRNCHAQCAICNYNQGEQYKYGVFMLKTYGQNVIDDLFRLNNKLKSWKQQELIDLRERYRKINKNNPLNGFISKGA